MSLVRLLLILALLVPVAFEGSGLDPHGGRITVHEGNGLDPHGLRATTDDGNGLDPHGKP